MKKTLKLMALLLCVASFATLSSCSKDNDNNGDSSNDLLVGRWEIVNHDSSSIMTDINKVGDFWEFKYESGNTYHFYKNGGEGGSGYAELTDNVLDMRSSGNGSYNIEQLTNTTLILNGTQGTYSEGERITFAKR